MKKLKNISLNEVKTILNEEMGFYHFIKEYGFEN